MTSEPICVGSFWQLRPEHRGQFDKPDLDGGAKKVEVAAVADGLVTFLSDDVSTQIPESAFRSLYECHHMPWQDREYMLGLRSDGSFWKWLFSRESLRFMLGKDVT